MLFFAKNTGPSLKLPNMSQLRQGLKFLPYMCLLAHIFFVAACARYAVKIELPELPKTAEVLILQNQDVLLSQLETHLNARGLTYTIHKNKNRVDVEVDWVKSLSLNYQYMSFGPRKRHMAHWKSVWRIERKNSNQSRLLVENMELVYLGPQAEAPAEAAADGNWASSPEAHRRAHMELHRFLSLHYDSHSYLTSFSPLSLDSSPLGTRGFRELTLQNAPRISPF